jgi:hypothetical protein
MPFENIHGNGGLLTTVGDLLKWNENFEHPIVGDAAFVAEQQTPGRFSDGRAHSYAFGLVIQPYRGVPEVSHSGSTAGYRAFLVRYPAQHVSVAVLCNAGDANATQFAHAVAELYMGRRFSEPAATLSGSRPAPAAAFVPSADLSTYAGRYVSDEAETEFVAAVDAGTLVLTQRPDRVLRLRPIEQDAFTSGDLGRVTFRRGPDGEVTGLSVRQDRVWDLQFQRR